MFNGEKVAQIAAYLLHLEGKPITGVKLTKIMYLADRQSLDMYGYSISGDEMISTPHGPDLSQTLDLVSGHAAPGVDHWNALIEDLGAHQVALRSAFSRDAADLLSDADVKILSSIFRDFRNSTDAELVEYTQTKCPEWRDPHGAAAPISPLQVFQALKKPADVAQYMYDQIEAQKKIDAMFNDDHFDSSSLQPA